ncbi:DNA modification methylase [Novosphingobium sp. AP12]|nr:DNA modification methylase [Novosphingobium sp. AP12]
MTCAATERVEHIGNATLYLGNAYAIRPTLGWMDADVMDPPYLIKTSGGGKFRADRPYLDQIEEEGMAQDFDHSIINPLLCGSLVTFCSNDQVPRLSTHLDGLFHRFALCAWRKLTPMPVANKHYVPEIEIYLHAWNRGHHPVGDVADLKRIVDARSRQSKDFGHPTVKPDAVMDKIIRNVAGGSVCDPFMGTGSTGVAAIRAGKRFVGIEHNPIHFETACRRIAEVADA